MIGRRKFMQCGIAALAGTQLALPLRAATRGTIEATRLADDLVLFSGAGGNVVTLGNAADGLLMVDTGAAEHTRELLKAVKAEAGTQRVAIAFNTHWHWDHTGGNEQLTKAGASLRAHAYTRQWLMTSVYVPWQERLYARRPPAAVPAVGLREDGRLQHAGQEVAWGHLWQAHTDGDLYLHFPKQNVLVVGGLMSVGSYPVLDYTTGGWIGGMVDASRRLLELCDERTRIVPGSGPVQSRADLQAQHDMLAALRPILVKGIQSGMNGDDMVAAKLTKDFDAKWGDPQLFLHNAYLGLWAHARELGKIV